MIFLKKPATLYTVFSNWDIATDSVLSPSVQGLMLPCALYCAGSQATNGGSASPGTFVMEGPMVALLMPFKPDSLEIDDASFVKYLEVGSRHMALQQVDRS